MICGSVSFTGGRLASLSREVQSDKINVSFHSVANGCFEGGYCLHPRLPYIHEEVFYASEKADILVLFSGALYNKPELLQSVDIPESVHDPEIIAGLFLKEGPGFADKLNGDFAIFIYRPGMKEAWLFRDHLGIRPMAWTDSGDTLAFSTDIIDLCRYYKGDENIDREYLLGNFKYIDYRKTPDEKVRKLAPGTYLRYAPSGIEIKRYWKPEKTRTDRSLSYDRMLVELKELVCSAIKIRCDKRFTAGAHFSGGIDSGIVAAMGRQEYRNQEQFYGFSWSPSDLLVSHATDDERDVIVNAGRKTGIIPVFSDMDQIRFPAYVSDFFHNQGYFHEQRTAEQALESGVNLILTGFGGDEFISTGHSGVDLDLLRGLKFGTFFSRNPLRKPKKFIRHFLFFVVFPALHILDPGSARSFRNDVRYIRKPFKKSDRKAISNFYFHGSRRRMHLNVLEFYNLPERCESWHLFGFQQGVEYRYPLLDKRIIEYMLKVPSELLCVTDQFRPLLRKIGNGLIPDELRLNQEKSDPVLSKHLGELNKSAALAFMEEVDVWKTNPDLCFVDFGLLERDIDKYRRGSGIGDDTTLYRTLVYLKALNEFTVMYRKDALK